MFSLLQVTGGHGTRKCIYEKLNNIMSVLCVHVQKVLVLVQGYIGLFCLEVSASSSIVSHLHQVSSYILSRHPQTFPSLPVATTYLTLFLNDY